MNYRHIYHAGNFADLMKHLILITLLNKLREKDKGFTVLDAFAGLGIYDLASEEARKTKEYENGIGMLRNTSSSSDFVEQNSGISASKANILHEIPEFCSAKSEDDVFDPHPILAKCL